MESKKRILFGSNAVRSPKNEEEVGQDNAGISRKILSNSPTFLTLEKEAHILMPSREQEAFVY
jgi:hypothetical protein